MPDYRIKEAADLLGVSDDTLRRWAEAGRIAITTDTTGRQTVDGVDLAQLAQGLGDAVHGPDDPSAANRSARNRFTGLVTRVVRDTVMAQVEIQAGPYRIVSLISREAADDLELEPGALAVATAKATNVSIETPRTG
jgi:molybdopterin-binding protein